MLLKKKKTRENLKNVIIKKINNKFVKFKIYNVLKTINEIKSHFHIISQNF